MLHVSSGLAGHLSLLLRHPLERQLSLVLQVLRLLLPHHLQLGGQLLLSQPLLLLLLPSLPLQLLLSQGV